MDRLVGASARQVAIRIRRSRKGPVEMDECRRSPRIRTYIGGKISFHASYCIVDCLVRDLSTSGAKLVLSGSAIIPGHFDLLLPGKGLKLRSEVVWRGSNRIGVTFLSKEDMRAAPR
jgi:hypothetical protein